MPQEPLKVLIADDSRVAHQLICEALPSDYSRNIVHAFNGVECLDGLDYDVDLAFIDVHMPLMGGMDALWSARGAGNKTFVTLISGRTSRHCIDLARKLDAYELLIKPFGNDEIDAIVNVHRRISTPMDVFLVDDSPVVLKMMRKVLSNSIFHLNIEEADAGDVAIARCKQKNFDVVFLDDNMPGLNRHVTLGHLMRDHRSTKVVIMSSEHNALREREALKLGAVAVMHKPFFPTEIDAVLHQLFGLQLPKLTTDSHIQNFEIKIHGRTIAAEHTKSGHVYEYVWFRERPHLRLPLVRENSAADIPANALMPIAKKMAMLELENAGLLRGKPH
jgi:CheY-like chemotaxis protein